jgi:hypothetical protein
LFHGDGGSELNCNLGIATHNAEKSCPEAWLVGLRAVAAHQLEFKLSGAVLDELKLGDRRVFPDNVADVGTVNRGAVRGAEQVVGATYHVRQYGQLASAGAGFSG